MTHSGWSPLPASLAFIEISDDKDPVDVVRET